MKVNITEKNFNASDHLKDSIAKKFEKLDKYFTSDTEAKVLLSQERGRQKIEATINAGNAIFRAEEANNDVYDGLDRILDKLSSQMSRFKTKLQRKHKENSKMQFEAIPEAMESDEDEMRVVRTKKFQLSPMTVDEAIMQMELLGHTFFIFMNMESDTVNVVYRRNDKNYGLLETTY